MRIKFSHNPFFTHIAVPKPKYSTAFEAYLEKSGTVIEDDDESLDKVFYEKFGIEPKTDEEIEESIKQSKERRKQKALELYYEFGIEPFLPQKTNSVYYFLMSEGTLTLGEYTAVQNALSNIMMAFDINPQYACDELWKIVKGDEDACFYEDCKYYDVDISVKGAFFMVAERFDYPCSVEFTGDFIRHFLWAYLTMRESPATPFSMEVSFNKEWVIFD